jgi:hypothetical protein
MIDPFKDDLGRRVVQQEYVGGPIQRGVITSFNPDYVYVQYDKQGYSTSVPREQLEYEEDFLARYR